MKYFFNHIIWKTILVTAFLLFVPDMANGKKSGTNTFQHPDFAYPRTVMANADVVLDGALKQNDYVAALRAAMQKNVAVGQISTDSCQSQIALFEDLAKRLPAPYGNLAVLMEATLYTQIYQSDRWQYNRRTLPSDNKPEDIKAWNRDIFSKKVCYLVSTSMTGMEDASSIPVDRIESIITNASDAIKQKMSIADFMTFQAADLLDNFSATGNTIIPFGYGKASGNKKTEMSAMELRSRILDEAIALHEKGEPSATLTELMAKKYESLPDSEQSTYLDNCVKRLWDTDYCAPLLGMQPYDLNDKINIAHYDSICSYIDRHPSAYNIDLLKQIKALYLNPSVRIETPVQIVAGNDVKVKFNVRNLQAFNILAVKVKNLNVENDIKADQLAANGTVVASKPVSVNRNKPFAYTDSVSFANLAPGAYVFVASTSTDIAGIIKFDNKGLRLSKTLVSGMAAILSWQRTDPESGRLYIVDAVNQQPLKGVKVTLTPPERRWNREKLGKPVKAVTNDEGYIRIFSSDYILTATKGDDTYITNLWMSFNRDSEKVRTEASLFTDLSIYHPGDTVCFAGVLWTVDGHDLKALADRRSEVVLYDANGQEKGKVSVLSDANGRFDGKFVLPADGLLGSYWIELSSNESYASRYFEVAEYKSPTFYVETTGADSEFSVGDVVKIKGKVMTYSGMPVAGAKVNFDVKYQPRFRFWFSRANGNANYGGETVTEADGSFTIELPTEGLRGTPYANGLYYLTVTATSPSGETQQAPSDMFSLGKGYEIISEVPERIELKGEKERKFSVKVLDVLGHPDRKTVYYRITTHKNGETVQTGSFTSPEFVLNQAALANPGDFDITFSLDPGFKENETSRNVTVNTVLWRKESKVPPCETMLWIPEKTIVVPEGSKTADVEFGSSYPDSYILVVMSDTENVLKREWQKVSNENKKVRVTMPSGNNRLFVSFYAMRDLKNAIETVTLIPERQTQGVEIATESFRDRIEPGAREQWKFKFTLADKALSGIPVMAVMTNKALNALAPFSWSFNPYGGLYWNAAGSVNYEIYNGNCINSVSGRIPSSFKISYYRVPVFEEYGRSMYGRSMYSMKIRGTRAMKQAMGANVVLEMAVTDESSDSDKFEAAEEAVPEAKMMGSAAGVTEDNADAGSGSQPGKEETLREVECPIAFFMPNLTTDASGLADVDFESPNFNGTWQFQIMGWTPDMRGSVQSRDVIASKPVMVQMNAPRFVRSGDKVTVLATVYNNGDKTSALSGKMEVFNPLTGEILKTVNAAPADVLASASRVISIEFDVPSELSALGIRAYGYGFRHSDGEQTVIPVHPSSTPVVEATPFWMAPGQKSMTVKIPSSKKGSRLTLTYTDNPVWECVTALPSISNPTSDNVLAQTYALYGNAIAAGLMRENPDLKTAILAFADPRLSGDSTLVSNLEKNSSLKTVALNNTPWVRDAQSETLRMQSLVEYADPAKSASAISASVGRLKNAQRPDGGWSWCEGMPSSEFITGRVLLHLAMLKQMGYMPEGCEEMALKAIGYCDREIINEVKKAGAGRYPYASLLDYLYIRSSFANAETSADFRTIKSKALAAIEAEWKKSGIYAKATAAALLWRESRPAVARNILESLRQYATVTPEKGMWFDTLNSSFGGWNKLITTAQVLEAYNEIQPSAPAVDQLRQWLVVTKQTENWGDDRETAEVIHSILSSGTKWTVPASAPEVKVAGSVRNGEAVDARTLVFPQTAYLTGSFTTEIDDASGYVQILRNGAGPAWGGIVAQYEQEIEDVKKFGTKGISITKALYSISTDSNGTKAVSGPLKVGDRVRVTLTITCDRDMEYVAVTDARSACLEPAEQVSGYSLSDGLWMYKEVRNDATNLFIPFIGKGTHIISYDCFVDREGEYSLGIAEAQSQYAPVFTAHSAGKVITVR